ncbi:MAG: hypothetical protein QOI36_510 [Pseudonocardiales bacterium]|nr:hypothetical protein [Pseudonocardiales bacterium]
MDRAGPLEQPESIGIRELRQHASRYVALDATHLATALLVREELDVLLSYDQRLLDAAQEYGIPTAAPV